MLLEAALNGRRTRAEHPAVPMTPEELAAAAVEARDAGAQAVHFHVRSRDGRESLDPADVDAAVRAVRRTGVPFGVSTGAWIVADPERRLVEVRRWTELPDFVSVNFDEDGATELARHFLAREVGLEAGVAHATAARVLVESGLSDRCLRIMLEPREADAESAMAGVEAALAVLNSADARSPRMLHGVDATAWPLLDETGKRKYQARIGLEDGLRLPDGSVATGNGELVRAARERLARTGWAPA